MNTNHSSLHLLVCVAFFGLTAGQASAQKTPYATLSDPTAPANSLYGQSLALLDFDGNGVMDIASGQPNDFGAGFQPGGGSVFVEAGPGATPVAQIYGTVVSGTLGTAVAAYPDMDGDGADELLIGQSGPGSTSTYTGRAFLYRMDATTGAVSIVATFTPSAITTAGVGPEEFGAAIAVIGDVDGGGLPDIAVGAPGASTGTLSHNGTVEVFSAEAAALGGTQSSLYTLLGTDDLAHFGQSITGLDDLDGDGVDDFAVGMPGQNSLQAAGVRIHSGSSTSAAPGAMITTLGGDPGSQFGWSLTTVADMVGDGKRELVVGAPNDSKTISFTSGNPPVIQFAQFQTGSVHVYSSEVIENPPIINPLPMLYRDYGADLADPQGSIWSGDSYGWSVANCGDLDGDGADDILVGDPGAQTYHPFQGGGGWPNLLGTQTTGQARLI